MDMQRFLLAILVASLFGACARKPVKLDPEAPSIGGSGLDLKVKKFVLPNGLRLLVYEDHRLPIFTYTTFFDVGGRYESKGTTGATHFLEHMMFKGAKKYGPGMFDGLIEGAGGSTNAYT